MADVAIFQDESYHSDVDAVHDQHWRSDDVSKLVSVHGIIVIIVFSFAASSLPVFSQQCVMALLIVLPSPYITFFPVQSVQK